MDSKRSGVLRRLAAALRFSHRVVLRAARHPRPRAKRKDKPS